MTLWMSFCILEEKITAPPHLWQVGTTHEQEARFFFMELQGDVYLLLSLKVQTLSPSPQRSASRFPPRLSCDTSCRPCPPPAPTRPARTPRPGRRMRRTRRRRPSEAQEEGGGKKPPWSWPWTKRRFTRTRRWWSRRSGRGRAAQTVSRAGRRCEDGWTPPLATTNKRLLGLERNPPTVPSRLLSLPHDFALRDCRGKFPILTRESRVQLRIPF